MVVFCWAKDHCKAFAEICKYIEYLKPPMSQIQISESSTCYTLLSKTFDCFRWKTSILAQKCIFVFITRHYWEICVLFSMIHLICWWVAKYILQPIKIHVDSSFFVDVFVRKFSAPQRLSPVTCSRCPREASAAVREQANGRNASPRAVLPRKHGLLSTDWVLCLPP